MILLVGPRGSVEFAKTSFFFRANIDALMPYLDRQINYEWYDFGIGRERAFRCCGCKRYVPLFTGTVDHVVPKSLLTVDCVDQIGTLHNSVVYKNGIVQICRRGKYYLIEKSSSIIYSDSYSIGLKHGKYTLEIDGQSISLKDALENDMENLQLMCGFCNSLKGNRV